MYNYGNEALLTRLLLSVFKGEISVVSHLIALFYLRNEFYFSDVYRSVNYIGSRAK